MGLCLGQVLQHVFLPCCCLCAWFPLVVGVGELCIAVGLGFVGASPAVGAFGSLLRQGR